MYAFPPGSQINTLLALSNILLSTLVMGGLACYLLRPGRKAGLGDLAIWLIVGVSLYLQISICYPLWSGEMKWVQTFQTALCAMIFTGVALSVRLLLIQAGQLDFLSQVVLGVIVVLLTLLTIPPNNFVRDAAKRTFCKNNLKQLGLAMHNYLDQYETFPLQVDGDPPRSWRVELLPYIEQKALRKRYQDTLAWNVDSNIPVAQTLLPELSCPSNLIKESNGFALTSYVVPLSPNGIYSDNAPPKGLKEISGGTGSTFLLVEACGQNIPWAEPRDVDSSVNSVAVNGPGKSKHSSESMISSYHKQGAMVLLANGSVRYLSQKTSPEILGRLLDATAPVGDEDF